MFTKNFNALLCDIYGAHGKYLFSHTPDTDIGSIPLAIKDIAGNSYNLGWGNANYADSGIENNNTYNFARQSNANIGAFVFNKSRFIYSTTAPSSYWDNMNTNEVGVVLGTGSRSEIYDVYGLRNMITDNDFITSISTTSEYDDDNNKFIKKVTILATNSSNRDYNITEVGLMAFPYNIREVTLIPTLIYYEVLNTPYLVHPGDSVKFTITQEYTIKGEYGTEHLIKNLDYLYASVYGYGVFSKNKTNKAGLIQAPTQEILDQGSNAQDGEVITPVLSTSDPIYLQTIDGNFIVAEHDNSNYQSDSWFISCACATNMLSKFTLEEGGAAANVNLPLLAFGTGSYSNNTKKYNAYKLKTRIPQSEVQSKVYLTSPYAEAEVTYNPDTDTYTRHYVLTLMATDTFTFSEFAVLAYMRETASGNVGKSLVNGAWSWSNRQDTMIHYESFTPITVNAGEEFQVRFNQSFTSLVSVEENGTSDAGQDTGGRGIPAVELTLEEQEEQVQETIQVEEDKGNTVSNAQEQIIAYALSKVGYKYSNDYRDTGDTNPNGYFDCSSLAYYACRSAGIDLMYQGYNTAAAEANGLFKKGKLWQGSNIDGVQPGDLVFYSFDGDNGRFMHISHVAIYTGNDIITHARNFTKGVCQDRLSTYGRSSVVAYGRPWA